MVTTDTKLWTAQPLIRGLSLPVSTWRTSRKKESGSPLKSVRFAKSTTFSGSRFAKSKSKAASVPDAESKNESGSPLKSVRFAKSTTFSASRFAKSKSKAASVPDGEERAPTQDSDYEAVLPVVVEASPSTETASLLFFNSEASQSSNSAIAERAGAAKGDDEERDRSLEAAPSIEDESGATQGIESVLSTQSSKSSAETADTSVDDMEEHIAVADVPSMFDDDDNSLLSTKSEKSPMDDDNKSVASNKSTRSSKSSKSLFSFKSARSNKSLQSTTQSTPMETVKTVTSADSTKGALSTLSNIVACQSTDTAGKSVKSASSSPREAQARGLLKKYGFGAGMRMYRTSVAEAERQEKGTAAKSPPSLRYLMSVAKAERQKSMSASKAKRPEKGRPALSSLVEESPCGGIETVVGKAMEQMSCILTTLCSNPFSSVLTKEPVFGEYDVVEADVVDFSPRRPSVTSTTARAVEERPPIPEERSVSAHYEEIHDMLHQDIKAIRNLALRLEMARSEQEASRIKRKIREVYDNLAVCDSVFDNLTLMDSLSNLSFKGKTVHRQKRVKGATGMQSSTNKEGAVKFVQAKHSEDDAAPNKTATDQKTSISRSLCGLFWNMDAAVKEVFHQVVRASPSSVGCGEEVEEDEEDEDYEYDDDDDSEKSYYLI